MLSFSHNTKYINVHTQNNPTEMSLKDQKCIHYYVITCTVDVHVMFGNHKYISFTLFFFLSIGNWSVSRGASV